MSTAARRCLKLALLLSLMLIPLALRATSLLHGAPPATASSSSGHSWSWTARHGRSSRTTAAAATVVSAEAVRGRLYRRARPRSAALAASDDGTTTRRLRQVAHGGDRFADDKRLAPTGSNPLHNLR